MKPWMIILLVAAAGMAGWLLRRPVKVAVAEAVAVEEPVEAENMHTLISREMERLNNEEHLQVPENVDKMLYAAKASAKNNLLMMTKAYNQLKAIV